MTHAYVVLAHDLPALLGRLVERIGAVGDLVVVHVDANVDLAAYLAAAGPALCAPNVVVLEQRLRTRWGSVELVRAPLLGMAAALAHGAPFSHLTLLTGQDYPIKPPAALNAFLARHPDRSFIRHFALPAPGPGNGLDRVQRRYYRVRGTRFVALPNRLLPFVPTRRVPLGHTPYKGAAYWTLARAHVEHVAGFAAAQPDYLRFWRRTFCPDEYVVQTILANSPARGALVDDALREIDWSSGDFHPRVVGSADLPRLAASPAYFTRKVDPRRDTAALDAIDAELLLTRRRGAARAGPS